MDYGRATAGGVGIFASLISIVTFFGPQSLHDVIRTYAGPSFTCTDRRILNASELAVCGSWQLSRLDLQLSSAYYEACGNIDKALAAEEVSWIKTIRNSCNADHGCLVSAYNDRLGVLAARAKPHCP